MSDRNLMAYRGGAASEETEALRRAVSSNRKAYSQRLLRHAAQADIVVLAVRLDAAPVGSADEIAFVPPATAAQGLVFGNGRAGGVNGFRVVLDPVPRVCPLDHIAEHIV